MMCRWVASVLGLALVAGPAAASELIDFARCITKEGATYYTADWCPHCARQNKMFGPGLGYLNSVDCTNGCADVHSYPTWTFRDGSRISGVASFDNLSRRTGCQYGATREEEPRGSEPAESASGGRERYMGGAKFIDVR
jgi:hypothetical protein